MDTARIPSMTQTMAVESIQKYDRFMMKYKVLVHESEEGFSVSCPVLPGCWSQGETEKEALENIQDAIREYLAATLAPEDSNIYRNGT